AEQHFMKSGVADGSRRGGYPYLRTSYQHPPGHGIVSADGSEQLRLIPTTWSCVIAILRPIAHGSYAIHFAHPGAPECSAFSPPRCIPLRRKRASCADCPTACATNCLWRNVTSDRCRFPPSWLRRSTR